MLKGQDYAWGSCAVDTKRRCQVTLAPPSKGARGVVSLQYNYPAMGDRLCIVPATYNTMPVDGCKNTIGDGGSTAL